MLRNFPRRHIVVLLLCAGLAHGQIASTPYWPSDVWRISSPERQGIDSRQLALIFDTVRERLIPIHSLILIRNGYLVLDAYFYPFAKGTVHDLASVTKSVTSTLIGIAIDKGYIKSVDQRVLDFFPEPSSTRADERWKQLTVRHLLTMTSGFCEGFRSDEQQLTQMRHTRNWVQFLLNAPFVSDPGERFAYCSCASHLLSAVLTRATGMNAGTFAKRHLYGPLGIRKVIWPEDPQGNNTGWGDSFLVPLDMAKLGYLFLLQGVWDGKQVVSSDWISEATRARGQASGTADYGYKWWLLKEIPGAIEARGRGGQRIVVLPSKQTVIVLTGIGGFEPGDIGSVLLSAIQSDEPLPENPAASRILSEKIARAAHPPQKQVVPPLPELAHKISRRTLRFGENPYGLKTMQLRFGSGDTGILRYSFYEPMNRQGGTRESVFGLDGVYRMSNTSFLHKLPVGAKGRWTNGQEFELELHMAGFNHLFRFGFQFVDEKAVVRIIDEGLGQFRVEATFEEPI